MSWLQLALVTGLVEVAVVVAVVVVVIVVVVRAIRSTLARSSGDDADSMCGLHESAGV